MSNALKNPLFFALVILNFLGSVLIPTSGAQAAATLKERLGDCYSSDLGKSDDYSDSDYTVNGHPLNQTEVKNVKWISHCVIPFLPGSLEDRVKLASEVTWWSLREGTLELSNQRLFRYSLCHNDRTGEDMPRSNEPLEACTTSAVWQVGIMSGQVTNYSVSEINKQINAIYGNLGTDINDRDILRWTASLAGYDEGSSTSYEISRSQGLVKRSWMLRNPLIGMELVRAEVENECLRDNRRWCYSGSYREAKNFSHTRRGMLQAIEDLRALYQKGQ